MKKFDAIVIGAGQAGAPLAKKLAQAGMKTVIIEKRFYGGTCVNDGCTPTKTWVASAKAAYMAQKRCFGSDR
jgi:pyruvate/2-oxoglutarate dehydrogenase complex dihydrolipoamide dehydrogenase (E3) component